jgi:eukaryotic-like serine/threonine-protein kinase
VNSASGELLKNGNRVKLQEQPFRLLVVLLENAGEIVTREELRHRIWRDDTFVDFDSSLRVAVGKLRDALGDDAENPRYVETIPRRGYRFLAPEAYPAFDSDVNSPPAEIAAAGILQSAAPYGNGHIAPREPPSNRSRRWIVASLLLLVVIAAASVAFHSFINRKVLTEKDTVILADFENSTGDPVFDETLRQGMAVQLEQSPFLNLIPQERIQQSLSLMQKSADARLTPEVAHEICERTASAAVLDGSITRLGTQYVLGLRAKDCRSGRVLAEEQVQATRKEDVLNALSEIASRFRTHLGESLTTVEKHNTPLADATTPSLEALKAYSTGLKVLSTSGEPAAVPFFQRATKIDPQFATAYAFLGLMYGAMGESALSADSTSKAYELRDRASDAERFFITASYDGRVTGNLEKAQQTCEAWTETYPREAGPHSYLAGFIYPVSGRYTKALDESQKILDVDPNSAIGYLTLAYTYVYLQRLDEAESTLQRASERKLADPDSIPLRYDIAFLRGDRAEMDRAVASPPKVEGAADWILVHQGFALAYGGQLRKAKAVSQRAVDLAGQAANKERAALFESGTAVWEAFDGEGVAAKRDAMAAIEMSRGREVEYGAALALALVGDIPRSQSMISDMETRFPEDTSVRFSYLPVLRGMVALKLGDPSRTIEVLQVAVPYELGLHRSTIHGLFGALYPIFVRGNAYLVARRGPEAAAEFQKILAHRGIVISDPVGALAHLQLGRAYALTGDTTKAQAAYQDFLTLWKDADPSIPLLKQARAEYAKLQ